MPKKATFDEFILIITLILVLIGLIMVYSSSAIVALKKFGDPYFFLKKQVLWAFLGIIGMLIMIVFDYHVLRKFIYPILAIEFALLIMVLIPQFNHEVNGVRRWLNLGFFSFQPSETAKLTLILYISHLLAKKKEGIKDFTYGFFPPVLVVGIFLTLIILQPDFGTTLIIGCFVFLVFFVAGARLHHMLSVILFSLPFIFLSISNVEYQKRRIFAFLNPWGDPTGKGFQIIQSFLALGKGGLFGLGFGGSEQKLFYLPEPYTDFIFAIIGEELGFVGVLTIVILFVLLVWRGMRIAVKSRDLFGTYLATGITIMIGLQALVNICVVTGLLPTKGLTLPFLSYGGTSLFVNLIGIGILLNISQYVED